MPATLPDGRKVWTADDLVDFLDALAMGEFDHRTVPAEERAERRAHAEYARKWLGLLPDPNYVLTPDEIAWGQKIWQEFVAENPEAAAKCGAYQRTIDDASVQALVGETQE